MSTISERIQFVCPQCELVTSLPSTTKRLICRCGFDTAGVAVGDLAAGETHFLSVRLKACQECVHYMGGERCRRVDLGCRNKFRELVQEPLSCCPDGVW